MVGVLSGASFALAAVSAVSGLVVPRFTKPATYAEGYLEPYDTYHTRYMAIGCQNQHGQPFFDQCCHPLLATETLEKNRGPQCNPANQPAKTPAPAKPNPPAAPPKSPAPPPAAPPKSPAPPPAAPPKSPAPPPAKPAPVPQPKPKPAPAPAPPSGGNVQTGGFATFYTQDGNAGACGDRHSDNDLIAAIQVQRYGDTGRKSSLCGKQVRITNTKNGKQVTVVIADACPGCNGPNSIDLSTGAFNRIATPAEGMVPISWSFV